MRMPLPAVLLALLLGVLSAFAVACGDTSELLSERRAARLTGDVGRVAEAVEAGDCEATAVRLQELQTEVANLPSSVSSELRRNLTDGVTQLTAQAQEECAGEPAETTQTEEEPPPAETTETEPTETEPPAETTETEPTETESTETEPPAETTPPTEPTPAPVEPDGGDGGGQGDGGTGGVGEGAT